VLYVINFFILRLVNPQLRKLLIPYKKTSVLRFVCMSAHKVWSNCLITACVVNSNLAWGGFSLFGPRLSDWYDKNLINPHERCVRRRGCGRGEGILAIVVFYYAALGALHSGNSASNSVSQVSQSALSGESVW